MNESRARLQLELLGLLRDPVRFAQTGRALRPYQNEILRAVWENMRAGRGDTISFMLARQMGKNELVARLQAFLLLRYSRRGGALVHGAPTFIPQALNARARLLDCLEMLRFQAGPLLRRRARGEGGRSVAVGRARAHFVSADRHANRVGLSATLALFADEFQDWEPGAFEKDFAPMRSTTNATACVWGTAWRADDPLQVYKQHNLEREAHDGRRRHFEYDWQALAALDDRYRAFVQAEIARLGHDHPIIRTQYRLLPIGGGGRLLSPTQLRQLQGEHPAQAGRGENEMCVAGLDLAGEQESGAAEDTAALLSASAKSPRDSVALTVGRVAPREIVPGVVEADCAVVYRAEWVGVQHAALYRQVLDLLQRVWGVTRVCVDATGIGAGLASFLREALGAFTVEPCIFDSALVLHTALAFNFLAMVNGGRIREPTAPTSTPSPAPALLLGEGSSPGIPAVDDVWRRAWWQYEHAQSAVRPGGRMKIFVPASEGHDDLLVSTLLCARAAASVVALPSGVSVAGDEAGARRAGERGDWSRF